MRRTLRYLAGLLPGVVVERRQWQRTRKVTCRVRGCNGLMRAPRQLAALRRSASTEVRPRRWPDDYDGLVI